MLSDKWADEDIHYPGDSWNDPPGRHLYGNFKAIYNLKKQNRHLKVLLSIGGWTYSPSFHPIVVNPALRATFVRSSIQLLEDYGIDGSVSWPVDKLDYFDADLDFLNKQTGHRLRVPFRRCTGSGICRVVERA